MDWLRAKAVLIVAFLLLDLALAWQLAGAQRPASFLALPGEPQVRAELARAGLRLAGRLPDTAEAVPDLRVEPLPVPEALVAALVPAEVRSGRAGDREQTGAGTLWRWQGRRAWLGHDGRLVYQGLPAPRSVQPPPDFPPARAASAALAWLRAHGAPAGLSRDGEPVYDPRSGAYRVRLVQRWGNGLPLLDGAVVVDMAPDGPVALDWQLWSARAAGDARPAPVVPAALILAREVRPGGVLAGLGGESGGPGVVTVTLGYRVGPGTAHARLAWRIEAGERARFDFDAVSGARLEPGPR